MVEAKISKHSYLEMIEDGLLTLHERKGASRQALWKCVAAKYPEEADFKQFLIRLKKLSHEGPVQFAKGRYHLEPEYKLQRLK